MQARGSAAGFTTVELITVVLIIGILVSVAVPLYVSSQSVAAEKVCYANQRELEGAVSMWQVRSIDNEAVDLVGVVDGGHPLIADQVLLRAPRCIAAPDPADSSNPTAAEGAYTLDGNGTVVDCTFGVLSPHGHY